jgi:site-specific recombinase XerD
MSALDDWLAYLAQRGRSEGTLASYRSTMRTYPADPLAVTVEDADKWWTSVEHLAPRTRARSLSCIRSFYTWAMRYDLVERDPTRRLDAPSLPKGAPRYVTKDQLEILRDKLPPDLRRAALLGAWAGLRVSEAAALNWDDVDTELMRLTVRHGKGDKARPVAIHAVLLDELSPIVAGANVVSGTEVTYTAATLQRRVNRAMKRAGVEATFHQLRHRFGTITYGKTGDPLAVAAAMGHASLETTRIYAAVSDDALARVAEAAVQ